MMRRLLLIASCLFIGPLVFSGCSRIPVVPPAITCDIPPELLAKECAQPSPIVEGATFMDLVDNLRADRNALQACKLAQEALRESLKACNQRIEEFNKALDELNRKNTKI